MTKIMFAVTGWLIRKFGLLLLLIAALLLAPSVKNAWHIVEGFQPELVVSEVVAEMKWIEKGNIEELKDKLNQKKTERVQLEQISCILPTCTFYKNSRIYRADVEIEVLTNALIYRVAIDQGAQTCQEYQRNQSSVNQLRQTANEFPFWFFWFPEGKALNNRLHQLETRQTELINSCQYYRAATKTFQANEGAITKTLNVKHSDFLNDLNELKILKEQTLGQVRAVLIPALWLLLGITLTPISFKIFAYYGIAPLAIRIFGVRLQPSASGELKVLSQNNYLQRITIKEGEEFLFDPALLRSAPDGAQKSTKWILDWSMPFTSIASGMYFLTRISSSTKGTVTISCDNVADGNGFKLTILEVPENSSIVLQPRCLAGIVQNTNHPIRITRHWKLGNLGSWLTLQLRYVVFHGTAKLVLKGNNGVEVDRFDDETTIDQLATLGFTANLSYSVARSDTFYAYYSGKLSLFNDKFSSGPGFYLHEVSPRKSKTGFFRIMTRPFEIIWDVVTNAIGI